MEKKPRKGVSLLFIYVVLTVVSFLLAGSIVTVTVISQKGNEEINRLTDGYLNCTNDILQLDETSDFLTERSREYVANGSKIAAERYVIEITESKTREKALEHFRVYFADTDLDAHLSDALANSDALAEQEFYAMRLSADYYGFASAPTRIQSIELNPEDVLLSKDQKLAKANKLVFGTSYQALKNKIDTSIQLCLDGLIQVTTERKQVATRTVNAALVYHDTASWILLFFMVGLVVSTWFLVLHPLRKTKDLIDAEEPVKVIGSSELRFVSKAYNRVYEENERKKEALLFEVNHDTLTGIPNRHDFVESCGHHAKDHLLFVIADVDRFKAINDTHGHASGDTVLTEVARRLSESFSGDDRVFRIGGDEFVLMVFDADMKRKKELEATLRGINETLKAIHDDQPDFPEVSLSFGVAEKKANRTFEITYRLADKALYRVKSAGGNGVAFDADFFKG